MLFYHFCSASFFCWWLSAVRLIVSLINRIDNDSIWCVQLKSAANSIKMNVVQNIHAQRRRAECTDRVSEQKGYIYRAVIECVIWKPTYHKFCRDIKYCNKLNHLFWVCRGKEQRRGDAEAVASSGVGWVVVVVESGELCIVFWLKDRRQNSYNENGFSAIITIVTVFVAVIVVVVVVQSKNCLRIISCASQMPLNRLRNIFCCLSVVAPLPPRSRVYYVCVV